MFGKNKLQASNAKKIEFYIFNDFVNYYNQK